MSEISLRALRLAFLDHESRVKLASDEPHGEHARLVAVKWEGGFLDGLSISLSEDLNVLIGGPGSGKAFLRGAWGSASDLPGVPEDALGELVDRSVQRIKEPQRRGQAQVVSAVILKTRNPAGIHRGPAAELSTRETRPKAKLAEIDREPVREGTPGSGFRLAVLAPGRSVIARFANELPSAVDASAWLVCLHGRCASRGRPYGVTMICSSPRAGAGSGSRSQRGSNSSSLWPAPRPSNNRR